MPRRLAGMLCDLPSTPSLNLNAAIVRTTIRDLGCAPPLQIQGSMQITGSSRDDARQAKIAQLFQRFERKANVRYLTLIGHSSKAARRRDRRRASTCLLTVISARGPYATRSWTTAILSNVPHWS
jgi:hypothetical protein